MKTKRTVPTALPPFRLDPKAITYPLAEQIGAALRAYRIEQQFSQEDVAVRMRRWGFPWTNAAVSAIELGTRELSVSEWECLPIALQTDHGTIMNALPADRQKAVVQIAPDMRLYTKGWTELVSKGGISETDLRELSDCPVVRQADRNASVGAASQQPAERKAAVQLGVSPTMIALAAQATFGHSLTAERDRLFDNDPTNGRLSPSGCQRKLGHISRTLIDTLRRVLEKDGAQQKKKSKHRRDR